MSELLMLGSAIDEGEYDEARVQLLALAYRLNRLRRLLDDSEVEQARYELENLMGAGE